MDISLATSLTVIGVGLGILEITVLGFGTVFLLFIAIGCLLSALLIFIGIMPDNVLAASLGVAIISSVAALTLWKPLKKLQNTQQDPNKQPNAFKGLKISLDEPLPPQSSIKCRYSGIEWQVHKEIEDQQTWPAGAEVEVIKAGVGKMWVRRTG